MPNNYALDSYQFLSTIFDQYLGNNYYEYLSDRFDSVTKNITEGSKHLDIGCGTGDLLKYSYSHGFRSKGIDVSPSMVEIAQSKLNNNIDVACMDIFEIKDGSWDIITANNDVLNYIGINHDLQDILSHISNILSKHGIFYADVVSDHDILNNWEDSSHSYQDGKTFHCDVNYKIKQHTPPIGIVTRNWKFKKNGKWQKKKREIEVLRGFSREEIIEASKDNKLSVKLAEFHNGNIEMVLTKNK